MSTIVYQDYYSAYDNGLFDIKNVDFNVKLVSEEYTPNQEHKPLDVDKYILNGISVLIEDDIATKSMGELIEKIKNNFLLFFSNFPEEIKSEIDTIILDTDKADKIKDAIDNVEENNHEIWNILSENGVKYFVVEYHTLNIVCFCEEVAI